MYEKYQSKQYCAMSENQLRGSAKGNCSSFRVLDPYIFLLAMKKKRFYCTKIVIT